MNLLTLPDVRFPPSLRGDAMCGPRVLWLALRHFGRAATARRVMTATGWDGDEGTHAIAMAVALAEHGLAVELQSDPDPEPHPREVPFYARAESLAIARSAPQPVETLLELIGPARLAILLFDIRGDGHFSLLRGSDQGIAVLNDTFMSIERLERARTAPGIFRQTIVVSDPLT